MFSAIVLICALGVSPADCDPVRSAGQIIVGGEFRNSLECLHAAMQQAALSGKHFGPGYYPKISCLRRQPGNQG